MNKKILVFIGLVSFCIVIATPFVIPATVTELHQLNELRLGFPFPFIEQHTTASVLLLLWGGSRHFL